MFANYTQTGLEFELDGFKKHGLPHDTKRIGACLAVTLKFTNVILLHLNDINFYTIIFAIVLLIKHQKMIITLPVENYSDIYQDKSCCLKNNEIRGYWKERSLREEEIVAQGRE